MRAGTSAGGVALFEEDKQMVEMKCRHYDREEINLVLDGITPPTIRCKTCGLYLVNGEWVEMPVL